MDISVIIPTYKPEDYIYACLRALDNQTLNINRFEVVIVLNGCKYPYMTLLSNYIDKEVKNLNIKLIQTDTAGVSNARNIGLSNAFGRYICFIDDDDIVSWGYLEGLLSMATDCGIVVSNVHCFRDNINTIENNYISKCFYRNCKNRYNNKNLFFYRSFLSSACCKLIPVSVIGKDRFDSKFRKGEDSLFMASISCRIKCVKLADRERAVYFRRYRSGSAVSLKVKFADRVVHALHLFRAYWNIYWRDPLNYNLLFFVSRYIATLLAIFR